MTPAEQTAREAYARASEKLDALKARVATCTPGELRGLRSEILRAKMACGIAFRRTRSAA
jgi:hypothetical protein